MKNKVTNLNNVPLSMAVWLASDTYDHNTDPDYISATGVMKAPRALVLAKRVEESTTDISTFVASRMGTAMHDAIEAVWNDEARRTNALKALGFSKNIIDQIKVNPTDDELGDDVIPIYMENRVVKTINGIKIGGKYDFIGEGQLEDFKSTSAWSYVYGSSTQDYIVQGSIYRWLNPDKVTEDTIQIDFVFTDWKKRDALSNPNYPQSKAMQKHYPLMSIAEIEEYLTDRAEQYKSLRDLPEADLPLCTDADLWRSDNAYKYFSNPEKTDGRCQKSFSDHPSALVHLQDKGKGTVIEVKGKVKRCDWCAGYDICTQKDALIADGSLDPKV